MVYVECLAIATLMRVVFDVPVAGSSLLLLGINLPFAVAAHGVGLLIP
jgi:ABC-2 type transport system permease protein